MEYSYSYCRTHDQMWSDLRKAGFHAHNSKIHFSPSNDSCTCWLTIQPGIDAEIYPGCFCCGLSNVHECTSRHQMAAYLLGKQTAGCNSPHDWLMSLAMDLTALCDTWRWKWHQWMPFGWFYWRRTVQQGINHDKPYFSNMPGVNMLMFMANC